MLVKAAAVVLSLRAKSLTKFREFGQEMYKMEKRMKRNLLGGTIVILITLSFIFSVYATISQEIIRGQDEKRHRAPHITKGMYWIYKEWSIDKQEYINIKYLVKNVENDMITIEKTECEKDETIKPVECKTNETIKYIDMNLRVINKKSKYRSINRIPSAKRYKFPLFIGQKWKDHYSGRRWDTGEWNYYGNDYEVVNYEKIETAAGEFLAYKIRRDNHNFDTSRYFVEYYWYAPEVASWVKSMSDWNVATITDELVQCSSSICKTGELASNEPPILRFLELLPSNTDKRKHKISIEYEDDTSFGELIIRLNGGKLHFLPDPKTVDANERLVKFNTDVELQVGSNVLYAYAHDGQGLSTEIEAHIEFVSETPTKGPLTTTTVITGKRPQLSTYSKKHAVVIGISDYKHLPPTSKVIGSLVDLKYADKDALAFENFLRNESLSGRGWQIHSFSNGQATKSAIEDALTQVLTFANQRDLIFIFFSGHGRSHPLRPQDVFLLTYDFDPDDKRSGLEYSFLRRLIADSKAEHIIAFIDACRSGIIGFAKGNRGSQPSNSR